MKIFDEICRLPEFETDLKKLLKRFKTLEEDLEIFIEKQLYLYHKLKIDNKGISQIPGLPMENPKIYKAKKFACRSLKGKGVQSGIRVIYACFEKEDKIEFIEIYYRGDKENEDRERNGAERNGVFLLIRRAFLRSCSPCVFPHHFHSIHHFPFFH